MLAPCSHLPSPPSAPSESFCQGKGAEKYSGTSVGNHSAALPPGNFALEKGLEGGIGEINDLMPVQSVGVEPLVYGTPHNTDHLSRIPLPQTAMLNRDIVE